MHTYLLLESTNRCDSNSQLIVATFWIGLWSNCKSITKVNISEPTVKSYRTQKRRKFLATCRSCETAKCVHNPLLRSHYRLTHVQFCTYPQMPPPFLGSLIFYLVYNHRYSMSCDDICLPSHVTNALARTLKKARGHPLPLHTILTGSATRKPPSTTFPPNNWHQS